jgi:AcrR family transcriptional regulator
MALLADSPHETAERLIAAGVEIAREEGLAAVTARSLAVRTGASPSALNYHLGGRETLVGHIASHALAAAADWRAVRQGELGDETGAPVWLSAVGGMAAIVGDRVSAFRTWSLLLSELEIEAQAKQDGVLARKLADEARATTTFWSEAAGLLGESPEMAEVWADLCDGLVQLLLGDEAAAAKTPWIIDAADRTRARLRRAPIAPLVERSIDTLERLTAPRPTSEGASRLIDAALRVIADKGAERLTLREVAAAAGLSLAATTYFFQSKAGLVSAAFHELHRQVREQALAEADNAGRTTLRSALEDEGETRSWRVRAMEALQMSSARDRSLAPLAREFRATRGATSIMWLRAMGLEVDRLDAFVYSTAMSGVVHRTRFASATDRREAVAKAEKRLLGELFGVRTSP